MVPADFKIPFFDSPLGLIIVLLAIVAGFYLFVGNKTPLDYHRQGRELHETEEKMQEQGNSKEAERNAERGEKIEQVSAGEREDERKDGRAKRRRRVDVEHIKAPYGSSSTDVGLQTPEADNCPCARDVVNPEGRYNTEYDTSRGRQILCKTPARVDPSLLLLNIQLTPSLPPSLPGRQHHGPPIHHPPPALLGANPHLPPRTTRRHGPVQAHLARNQGHRV
jgi:hypothetical protein